MFPLRPQVEEAGEEVASQRLGSVGENAVSGLPEIGVQGPQAPTRTDISGGQSQHQCPVDREVSAGNVSPARRLGSNTSNAPAWA